METVENFPTDDALERQAAMPADDRAKVTGPGTTQTIPRQESLDCCGRFLQNQTRLQGS